MSILKSSLTAAALVTSLAVSSIAPTQAAPGLSHAQRDRVIEKYCDRYSNDRDCIDYRQGHWNSSRYDTFYSSHRSGLDSISSGLFGLGFAAVLGSALAGSVPNNDRVVGYANGRSDDHVSACQDRYQSYSVRTDTYLGFDGKRHACNL